MGEQLNNIEQMRKNAADPAAGGYARAARYVMRLIEGREETPDLDKLIGRVLSEGNIYFNTSPGWRYADAVEVIVRRVERDPFYGFPLIAQNYAMLAEESRRKQANLERAALIAQRRTAVTGAPDGAVRDWVVRWDDPLINGVKTGRCADCDRVIALIDNRWQDADDGDEPSPTCPGTQRPHFPDPHTVL